MGMEICTTLFLVCRGRAGLPDLEGYEDTVPGAHARLHIVLVVS